jgi:hypothetical protein
LLSTGTKAKEPGQSQMGEKKAQRMCNEESRNRSEKLEKQNTPTKYF